MAQPEPTARSIDASDAGPAWSQALDRVARSRERVVVERDGVPVAAIISSVDLELLRQLEKQRTDDFAVLDEIGEAFEDESPALSERLATQAVAEARAARRELRAIETA
jgi:hypothetical protein